LGIRKFIHRSGIDLSDCLEPEKLDTAKGIFERRLKFWECRPMEDAEDSVVSPADARMVVGCLSRTSSLFIKNKFFDIRELLSMNKPEWVQTFVEGDYAIFRLTPDKYHYNHVPVTGKVIDFFAVEGRYHSCNPSALVSVVSLLSKNRRVVTIIDTNVAGGTWVGLVAMIEVVALAVGQIEQGYSEARYDEPKEIAPGIIVSKGCVKSLFRPGSSTVILLFEKGRVRFPDDLIDNMRRSDVTNRFGLLGTTLVEIDVKVRSTIARKV
jgi:phosphatidylserine decarboxylase